MPNTTKKRPDVGKDKADVGTLIDEALEVAREAQADLESFDNTLKIQTAHEAENKTGEPVKVLIINCNFEGFFALFNRFGNPIEYLAPDSPEMTAYTDALTSGDIDFIMNNPYEYNERGYRTHTGKMTAYKNAMSNIKLTPENMKKIGQAALTALDTHVTGFFYLNRVSSLTGLLGQAKSEFITVKTNDTASL